MNLVTPQQPNPLHSGRVHALRDHPTVQSIYKQGDTLYLKLCSLFGSPSISPFNLSWVLSEQSCFFSDLTKNNCVRLSFLSLFFHELLKCWFDEN